MDWLIKEYPELNYVSISGNFCTDKKVSAVNGLLGRGKYTIAEVIIPEKLCHEHLHTTPEKIIDLNIKKNLLTPIFWLLFAASLMVLMVILWYSIRGL